MNGEERAAHELEQMPASILTLNHVDIQHSPRNCDKDIPMPALNYVSQTPQSVSVTYSDLPAGADAVFVNQVSGAKTPSPSSALARGQRLRRNSDSEPGSRPILLARTKFRSVRRPDGHVLHQLRRRCRDRPLRSFCSRGPLEGGTWQEIAPDRCSNDLFVARARALPLCCRREFAMFRIGQHCCPNW